MKEIISILITFVMVFNLTSEVFAQSLNIKGSVQEKNYFPQNKQAGQEKDKLLQEIEKTRQAQENVSRYGITYEDFKKEITDYAKENKMNIKEADIQTSWQNYVKQINRYERDYLTLVQIFNKKTYLEVITDSDYFLTKSEEIINYDGKKYDRSSFLHAAVKNLATRHNTGYFDKDNQAKQMSEGQKIEAMSQIYEIVSREGFNPQDKDLIYNFTYNIVANGKQYFDNDFFVKHNLVPAGLRSARNRQKNEQAKDARQLQASIVAQAMVLLPVISDTSEKKAKSAKAIYEVASKIMRNNYGTIGIVSGAEALIALKTDDSLNKLYTLLSEDLYRSLGTELTMYFLDSFSVEEWAKRNAAFADGIKNGLGQYHNAIARRFLYIDPKKNSADKIRIASAADESLEAYYNVVYTDILEDIGKTLGSYSKDAKVATLINKLVSKYIKEVETLKARQKNLTIQTDKNGYQTTIISNTNIAGKSQTAYERESNLHTSLIVGILATTKQKNENLTKAAQIIYNGYWWDLTEATQRDKNNIAAKYLGLQNKGYNAQKQKQFALLTKQKNVGRFADIFVQAAMLGKLVISIPNIVRAIKNFAVNRIKAQFKTQSVGLKPVEVKATSAKSAEVKPIVKSVEVKPAEVKPAEVKPIEAKPIEVKPLEMPKVPAAVEPVKLPAVAEPVANPVAAKVVPTVSGEELATITKNVKWDILGKYYQRPVAMAILPFGFFKKISDRISAFLTNRPYLGEGKMAKARTLIDEAATEVASENLPRSKAKAAVVASENLPRSEAEAAVKVRSNFKIYESADFTAQEKLDLIGPEDRKILAKYYYDSAWKKVYSIGSPGDYKGALEYYKKAISLNPNKAKYYYECGDLLSIYLKDYKGSLPYYDKAISLNPQNAEYYFRYGEVKSRMHDYKGSLPYYDKAISLDPQNAEYYFRYGQVKSLDLHDYKGSLPYYDKAISLDPTNFHYYFNRALAKWHGSDDFAMKEAGIEDMKKAAQYRHRADYTFYEDMIKEWTEELKQLKEKQAQEAARKAEQERLEAARQAELARQQEAARIKAEQEAARKAEQERLEVARKAELARQKAAEEARQAKVAEEAPQVKLAKQNALAEAEREAKLAAQARYHGYATEEAHRTKAEEFIRKAEKFRKSFNASDYNDLARAKANLYDYKGAVQDMEMAVKLDPDSWVYREILTKYTKQLPSRVRKAKLARQKAAEEARKAKAAEEARKAEQEAINQAKTVKQKTAENKTAEIEDPKYEATQYFEKAKKAATLRSYKTSLGNYNKAIELDNTNAAYYYERALLKRNKLRDLEGGIEDLKQACKYNPNSATYKETLAEWTRQLEGKNANASPEQQARIKAEVDVRQNAEAAAKQSEQTDWEAKSQAEFEKQKADLEFERQSKIKMEEADKQRKAEFEKQQAQTEREIELQKQEDALKQTEQEKQRLEQEQAAKAERQRRYRLTKEQREAEDFYNMALESKKRGLNKQAYDYFEQAISKETRKAVKAQYAIEQARFLRYAKGTGKDRIVFRNEKGNNFISYNEAALMSYDRAVEYAPNNKVKAQYLLERADFKRFNKDFEGAQADIELAKKLDPSVAK